MASSEFGSSRPNRRHQDDDSDHDSDNDQLVPFPEDQADQIIGESEMDLPDEDSDGEDIMNNPEDDYRHIPELDTYENKGIDDDVSYGGENDDDVMAARRRAEMEMDRRDESGVFGKGGREREEELLYEDEDDMGNREAADRAMAYDQGVLRCF